MQAKEVSRTRSHVGARRSPAEQESRRGEWLQRAEGTTPRGKPLSHRMQVANFGKSRHRIAPAHTKIPPPTYDAHQKGTTCGHLCSDEVIHSTTTFSSFQAVGSCVVSFCGFGRLSESTSIPIVSSEIHAHERDLSRQLGWLILLEPTWVNSVERHRSRSFRR